MTQRKTYAPAFKREAVALALENGFAQTGRDLGLNPNLIHRWKKRLDQDGERAFPGHGTPRDAELAHLRRENARMKEELAILKKAVGIFSKSPH